MNANVDASGYRPVQERAGPGLSVIYRRGEGRRFRNRGVTPEASHSPRRRRRRTSDVTDS